MGATSATVPFGLGCALRWVWVAGRSSPMLPGLAPQQLRCTDSGPHLVAPSSMAALNTSLQMSSRRVLALKAIIALGRCADGVRAAHPPVGDAHR